MQTQRYLIDMQDNTRLQKYFFLLDGMCIPNTVIDSCQKHYISPLLYFGLPMLFLHPYLSCCSVS